MSYQIAVKNASKWIAYMAKSETPMAVRRLAKSPLIQRVASRYSDSRDLMFNLTDAIADACQDGRLLSKEETPVLWVLTVEGGSNPAFAQVADILAEELLKVL